jgi:hypothetical protein
VSCSFDSNHSFSQQQPGALHGTLLDESVILVNKHLLNVSGIVDENYIPPGNAIVRNVTCCSRSRSKKRME